MVEFSMWQKGFEVLSGLVVKVPTHVKVYLVCKTGTIRKEPLHKLQYIRQQIGAKQWCWQRYWAMVVVVVLPIVMAVAMKKLLKNSNCNRKPVRA